MGINSGGYCYNSNFEYQIVSDILSEFACKIELRKYACLPIYNLEMLYRRMEAAKK